MGNLRSVAQGAAHVAPGAQHRRHRRPEGDRATRRAWCCPGRARCPTAWQASTRAGLREVVLECLADQPVPRHLPRAADAVRGERGGAHALPRRPAGAGACASASGTWRCPAANASRSRTWAGARCTSSVRTRCGPGSRTDARFYFAAQLLSSAGRPGGDRRRRPPIRRRLLAPSRGIISSPRSSTPKKASAPACNCSRTSSAGTDTRRLPVRGAVAPHRFASSSSPAAHADHSRDRSEGRPLRAPETGRHGDGHGVLGGSRRDGAGIGSSSARSGCTSST